MTEVFESILELDQPEIRYEDAAPLAEQSTRQKGPYAPNLPGVIVGILAGFKETGAPLVNFTENAGDDPLLARSTVPLSIQQVGCELALVFEQGDLTKPIILGCMPPQSPPQPEVRLEATLDGEHVILSAQREMVLRCGKSSITLTRAGKVIIRGDYLLSRSSGVNRIKGGSVQIN